MSEDAELPIKIAETFTRVNYFKYTKIPFYNGRRIPLVQEKGSKIGSESRETIPSLNTKLNGIYSTGVAFAY